MSFQICGLSIGKYMKAETDLFNWKKTIICMSKICECCDPVMYERFVATG